METNPIHEALQAYVPRLASSYRDIITNTFDRILSKLGPSLNGIYNDWEFARVFRATIVDKLSRNVIGDYHLNDSKLATNAVAYAKATVEAWEAKITAKLPGVANIQVKSLGSYEFEVTGQLAHLSVRIEQKIITKVSSKGLVFNQFPSRIYVAGHFTPEKDFKTIYDRLLKAGDL